MSKNLNNRFNQVLYFHLKPQIPSLNTHCFLATNGREKYLGACYTQFHDHAWAAVPAFYAGMSQFSQSDFIRKAIEMRAVRDDIMRRMSQCGNNPELQSYLKFQLQCLPPQLDQMNTLPISACNRQVHLGGLAYYAGDTDMRGEVHTIRVDGVLVRYRDQAYPRDRPIANMNALLNYDSATRLLARLPATTTLAEAQHKFQEMLLESDSGTDEEN